MRLGFALLFCALAVPAEAKDFALSQDQQKNLGIAVKQLAIETDRPIAQLPAVLRPARSSRFVVVAPFAGTVTDVIALEGQPVALGTHLATVFSRDLLASQSQLAQVRAELGAAAAAAERTRALASEGIVAGARAQEAEARANALHAQIAELESGLRSVRSDAQRPGFYRLVASSAGRVASIDIEPGSPVNAMANAVTIDKFDKLWADAQLPPELAGQVTVGTIVETEEIRGKVIARGIAVDTKTRSVLVRAEFPAVDTLMAGASVTISVLAASPGGTFTVPRAAVVRVGGKDSVFVMIKDGFRTVPVEVVGRGDESLAIVGELIAQHSVAISGVAALKALAEN